MVYKLRMKLHPGTKNLLANTYVYLNYTEVENLFGYKKHQRLCKAI